MTKTVGIGADNYKLERFKKELAAKGYTEVKVTSVTANTSLIRVTVKEEDVIHVYKICQRVELHFKRGN